MRKMPSSVLWRLWSLHDATRSTASKSIGLCSCSCLAVVCGDSMTKGKFADMVRYSPTNVSASPDMSNCVTTSCSMGASESFEGLNIPSGACGTCSRSLYLCMLRISSRYCRSTSALSDASWMFLSGCTVFGSKDGVGIQLPGTTLSAP